MRPIRRKDKRAVSELIGYVLLVVFAVIISVVTYTWLKSYVPAETLECKDGVSVFLKEASFKDGQLNLTLRNNGRFNLTGFFVYATNSSTQELGTLSLSKYLDKNYGGVNLSNSVYFYDSDIFFKPGDEEVYVFNIPAELGSLYAIRVIPTRFEDVDGKQKYVSCTNARVTQIVGEPIECQPQTCSSLGYQCNPPGWVQDDGCGNALSCGTCDTNLFCNKEGSCEAPPTSCGLNGIEAGEQCDDGSNNGVACTPTYAGSCNYCSSLCESITVQGPYCGDSSVNGAETCEIGGSTSCTTNGYTGTKACNSACTGYETTCTTTQSCGDTTVNGNEVCDGGTTSCTTNGYTGTKACNSGCTGYSATCTATQSCGDGIKNGNEGCDDNGVTSGDGCSSTCTVETGYTCSGTAPSSCTPICGDGLKKGNEGCDDGGTTNGNGCSSSCQVESGYTCSGTPSSCSPVCGDGIITSPETCDQGSGNVANGDGCSSVCHVESGYTCSGTPSSCSGTSPSCPNTCAAGGYSAQLSYCTNSAGNCATNGGTHSTPGDQYCTGGPQADTCCCNGFS